MKEIIVKYIPNGVSVKVARTILRTKKNSPAIMFGAGIATAVASTVMACKATLKFEEVLIEAQKDQDEMRQMSIDRPERYSENDLARDLKLMRVKTAVRIGKLYAPSVCLGIVSVGLLTGAHVVLTKRNAGLTAAYVALDKGFREYRDRVVQEFGEDKDRELRFGTIEKEIIEEGEHGHEVKTVKRNAVTKKSVYARYYDESNKHWSPHPHDNKVFLMSQQSWLNDRLGANGYVMLNDVYDCLGMERSTAGAVVGWVKNSKIGDGYIDFGLGDSSDPVIRDFMFNNDNTGILLDFNVDGPVFELIDQLEERSKR
jgi:hypothetical protein